MQKETLESFQDQLKDCALCPHECHVDRTRGQKGFCRSGDTVMISQAMAHFGEEPPISARNGSGTIFFSNCNMRCCYCQNHQISQAGSAKYSRKVSDQELADIMIGLMQKGCHNINLVSPTIWVANIFHAVKIAKKMGLGIPVLYNCGGYEKVRTIQGLEGMIDIYMPDMRYAEDGPAYEFSHVKDYGKHNRESIREMFRQVGPLVLDNDGAAVRGLLIRLLVLPNNISGTKESLSFIAKELSLEVALSIMSQYRPVYHAHRYEKISRPLFADEYLEVVEYARKLGFENAYIQDCIGLREDPYLPDFNDKDVFRQEEV